MSGIASCSRSILDSPSGTAFLDFLRTWNDGHIAQWLTDIKCGTLVETFRYHDIRGDLLLELDQDMLKEMGIESIGDRLRIVNGVRILRNRCSQPDASHSVSAIVHTGIRPVKSTRKTLITNGTYYSHSRFPSMDVPTSPWDSSTNPWDSSTSPKDSPTTPRAYKRNRPSPIWVPSPGARLLDLLHIIQEPQSADTIRNATAIFPFPQSNSSSQCTTPNSDTTPRPSFPPLPPDSPTPRAKPRTLQQLIIPLIRTPSQEDVVDHANSPLTPVPISAVSSMLTIPSTNPESNRSSFPSFGLPANLRSPSPSFGLPANPRSPPPNMKPPMRSPSPFASISAPCAANPDHNRNISSISVPSPFVPMPTEVNLAPRPSSTGTSPCPHALTREPTPHGQNSAALLPVIESPNLRRSGSSNLRRSGSSSRSRTHPAASLKSSPSTRITTPSLHNLRCKLVKFILPEEGQSYVIDVADCADSIEVVEKVLQKAEKAGLRRNDVYNITRSDETANGGFSVDGWSVYIESDESSDSGNPLSEAELEAICQFSSYYSVKSRGLTLRKTKRSKDLYRIFGQTPPQSIISSTSSLNLSQADDEADVDKSLAVYGRDMSDLQSKKSRAIKGATTVSILSVHESEKPQRNSSVHPVNKPPKLRNLLGRQLTTHLTEHFPFMRRKALKNTRLLCPSSTSGEKSGPPPPSRFSASSTHSLKPVQRSGITGSLTGLWGSMKRS